MDNELDELKVLSIVRDVFEIEFLRQLKEDGQIADDMKSYWQNLNSGSE